MRRKNYLTHLSYSKSRRQEIRCQKVISHQESWSQENLKEGRQEDRCQESCQGRWSQKVSRCCCRSLRFSSSNPRKSHPQEIRQEGRQGSQEGWCQEIPLRQGIQKGCRQKELNNTLAALNAHYL